jgi:acyl carrier protein
VIPRSKALEVVRAAAKKANLLDGEGRLVPMDSLAIIDLVVALEAALRIQIPTANLRQEVFESLETVAQMIEDLTE